MIILLKISEWPNPKLFWWNVMETVWRSKYWFVCWLVCLHILIYPLFIDIYVYIQSGPKKCIHSCSSSAASQCLDADVGHFEHLHWIQNSRTSLISILLLYKYSSYDYRVIFFMSKCVYIFWATLYICTYVCACVWVCECVWVSVWEWECVWVFACACELACASVWVCEWVCVI